MSMKVSIKLIADYPQLMSTVGEIWWREWGHPAKPDRLDGWINVTIELLEIS